MCPRKAEGSYVRTSLILVAGVAVSFSAGLTPARAEYEIAKLVASDAAERADLYFGFSVAVSGDRAVIGAPADDTLGDYAGSAYVFRRDNSIWIQEAKLMAADGAELDLFGYSVAISGDTILISNFRDDDQGTDSGSAYVFRYNGSSWVQEAKLLPADGAEADGFGISVSTTGDRALIGAYAADAGGISSGAAYVFRRDGSNWVQETKLVAADGAAEDFFGCSVALAGDAAVIGAPYSGPRGLFSGSAYVFRADGSNWVQETRLVPADGAAYHFFGASVALEGDTALIGASNDGETGAGSNYWYDGHGSAYVYRYDGSTWTSEAKLLASDRSPSDHFGSVAMGNDLAVVGAPGVDGSGLESGAAYLFRRDGSTWSQLARLVASDSQAGDTLGGSTAVSGGMALIGATRDGKGSVYVFNPAEHDCNGNGTPDVYDIAAGTSQDCNANDIPDECEPSDDCNGNGIQDICDVAAGGASTDCNGNGIPDECDVAPLGSFSTDCNTNIVPDECEAGALVVFNSGQLTPFGYEVPQHYTIASPPLAGSDVTVTLRVRGDFGNSDQNCLNEHFNVDISGTSPVQYIFYSSGHDCPAAPDVHSFVVPAATYNQVAASGSVTINMVPNFRVGAYECHDPPSYAAVSVEYRVQPDCNGNGAFDECDISSGVSGDCNANRIPDECEDCNGNRVADVCDITDGTSQDCNANNVPDECEMADRDCNTNGVLDSCDLVTGTSGDCNHNRIPDECDVAGGAYLLTRAGSMPAGNSPHSVTMADFDADGHLDLAVSNEQSDRLSVLLGNGAGGFVEASSFPAGSHGMAVIHADFNGDEHLDLAVANELYDNVAILLGDGSGGFILNGTFPAGDTPVSLAVGDFNEDDRLDLAIADREPDEVHVLLGDGTGGFAAGTVFPAYNRPRTIMAGDFNEDTHLDLAVASEYGSVFVFVGDGAGGFGRKTWHSSSFTIHSMVMGDFNNDEHLDLVAASSSSHDLLSYQGDGAGGFSRFLAVPVGFAPQAMAASDLNNDGDTDLVIADYSSHRVAVLRGNGDGLFTPLGTFYAGQYPRSLAIGDINEDNSPDVVAVNMQASEVSILLQGIGNPDCNANLTPDDCDIAAGTSRDCDGTGVPDECEPDQPDEDADGVRDACDRCPHTPQGLSVDLEGCPPYVPGDMNRDGDVDQEDFGNFQSCLSGSGVPQTDPACQNAKLDLDSDVDLNDLKVFQKCMSGANVWADPDCAE
jgi:hypothetical protein